MKARGTRGRGEVGRKAGGRMEDEEMVAGERREVGGRVAGEE
jgi:hypothetical protein